VGMINLTFVLRSLKGRCNGNQLTLAAKTNFDNIAVSFYALAFRNRLEYRNLKRALTAEMTPLHDVKFVKLRFSKSGDDGAHLYTYMCKQTFTGRVSVLGENWPTHLH